MDTVTDIQVPRVIDIEGFGDLFLILVAEGYRVIGPAVQDGAIVLTELSSPAELPFGWGVTLAPGGYRLRRRDDAAVFGYAAGPQSWKRFLHPPRERLWSATRTPDGLDVSADDDEPPRYAFLGVHPCDLHAIAIHDRVLSQPGSRYAARRDGAFIVAVNCTEPGETCFCASMNSGPGAGPGFDLALTELLDERGHRFLVDISSAEGADIMTRLDSERADDDTVRRARSAVAAAADRMNGPAADHLHDDVARLLQRQAALNDVPPRRGYLDPAAEAEEIRRVQQVDVQRMALDPLPAVQQPVQVGERSVDGHAAGPSALLEPSARRIVSVSNL